MLTTYKPLLLNKQEEFFAPERTNAQGPYDGRVSASVPTIDTSCGQNREKRHQCFVRLLMNARALNRRPLISRRVFPRSAPPSVTIANFQFSIFNFQFRREICDDAVLLAACRAVLLACPANLSRWLVRHPSRCQVPVSVLTGQVTGDGGQSLPRLSVKHYII